MFSTQLLMPILALLHFSLPVWELAVFGDLPQVAVVSDEDLGEIDNAQDLVDEIVLDRDAEIFLAINNKRGFDEYTADRWVFGNRARSSRRTPLDDVLAAQVSKTCQTYRFSDENEKKLLLAGRADILRFFQQVDELRQKLVQQPFEVDKIHKLRASAIRLRQKYEGFPFREPDSLYTKTLNRILRIEKITPVTMYFIDDPAALEAAREVEYYESLARLIGDQLAANSPLRDKKQRIQLAEFLRQQLQKTPMISMKDPADAWRKLAEIPNQAWQSILDPAQLRQIELKFDADRAAERIQVKKVDPG